MSPQPPAGPPDPFGPLAEGAVAVHNLFLAYVEAGFTEHQAIYIVGQMLAASIRGPAT
jgi:hypothetical protein